MKLKLKEILSFDIFYNTIKSQKISIKIAYKLAQLARSVEIEQKFYQENFHKILQEYAVIDENGQLVQTDDQRGIKIKPGSEFDCEKAMNELLELEVNLPDITFSIEDFDGIELTTEQMMIMLPFIVD